MNLRERYEQLERRVLDLEARLEAMDGKQPAAAGGVTRIRTGAESEGVELFVPGSGAMTERPARAEVTALPVKPIASIEDARAALAGRRSSTSQGAPK